MKVIRCTSLHKILNIFELLNRSHDYSEHIISNHPYLFPSGLSVLPLDEDAVDFSRTPIKAPRGYRDEEDSKSSGSNNKGLWNIFKKFNDDDISKDLWNDDAVDSYQLTILEWTGSFNCQRNKNRLFW